jgi:predicted porin
MNINVAGGLGSRDTYVGLSGGFGTVLAGKLNTPYKSSTVSWDPFLATSLQARGSGGMSDAQNGYATSALAYANKFGPATVVLALVVDSGNDLDPLVTDKTNGKHAKSLSVNVPVGPVEVAVAYVNANEFSDIDNLGLSGTADLLGVNTLETLTASKVGVKYAAGPITVAGQYEALDIDDGAGFAIKPTVAYVTGSYAMGANTFSASYGDTKWDISGVDNTKYMAIGLTHAFSKSTSSTIGYRSTDAGNFGDKETAFAAGLRVSF